MNDNPIFYLPDKDLTIIGIRHNPSYQREWLAKIIGYDANSPKKLQLKFCGIYARFHTLNDVHSILSVNGPLLRQIGMQECNQAITFFKVPSTGCYIISQPPHSSEISCAPVAVEKNKKKNTTTHHYISLQTPTDPVILTISPKEAYGLAKYQIAYGVNPTPQSINKHLIDLLNNQHLEDLQDVLNNEQLRNVLLSTAMDNAYLHTLNTRKLSLP